MTVNMLPPDDTSVGLSRFDKFRGVTAFLMALVLVRCVPLWVLESFLRGMRRVTRPAQYDATVRLIQAVRWANRIYLGRAACVEVSVGACCASLLTWQMPVWCVGPSFRPVELHAWVEVNGMPVAETDVDNWPYRALIRA